MEAGFRPERIIAAVALLLVGASAAVAGLLALVAGLILGFEPPDMLHRTEASLVTTMVVLFGFGIASLALAAMTLAGWHAQLSLAAATALIMTAVVAMGLDRLPGGWLLPAVGLLNAGAFLAGTLRRYRG